jgi:hypothetical protein
MREREREREKHLIEYNSLEHNVGSSPFTERWIWLVDYVTTCQRGELIMIKCLILFSNLILMENIDEA